jgi:hypothetical protein
MRILVLALMIALLPLRGWVGDAMAMSSVGSSAAAQADDVMPADCAMRGGDAAASHGQLASSPHKTPCAACDSCELCLPLFMQEPASPAVGRPLRHAVPVANAAHFASVQRNPALKPPIS